MATYTGKNSYTSTRILSNERTRYSTGALRSASGPDKPNIANFTFAQKVFYGRVNTEMNPVVPKKTKMLFSQQTGDENGAMMFDFVKDAFEDMTSDFKRAVTIGAITDSDNYLSGLRAFKGYSDPLEHYNKYLEETMDIYIYDYLVGQHMSKHVMNLANFIDHFLPFAEKLGYRYPTSLTAWHRSRNSSMYYSGLVVDVAGLPYDDDHLKSDNFLNNKIFPYYLNVALSRGFYVSKHSPWSLVADLGSPAMQRYMMERGIPSTQSFFTFNYNQCYLMDQKLLRRAMTNAYNRFARLYPIEKRSYVCRSGRLKSELKKRQRTSFDHFSKNYSDLKFLRFYCRLRNIEEDRPYDESQMKKMDTTIRDLQKIFDTSRALGYINEEYRKLVKTKEGSLSYYKNRLEERRIETENGIQSESSGRPSEGAGFGGGEQFGTDNTGGSGGGTGGTGGSGGGMSGGGGY